MTLNSKINTYTETEALDDPEFLSWVERIIAGVEARFETDQCYVVKIDNWFGQRWLGFWARVCLAGTSKS